MYRELPDIKGKVTFEDLGTHLTPIPSAAYLTPICHLSDTYSTGTPLTNNFYLGVAKGECYGLALTPERLSEDWLKWSTPIEGLYFSGQDPFLNGVAGAATSGFRLALGLEKNEASVCCLGGPEGAGDVTDSTAGEVVAGARAAPVPLDAGSSSSAGSSDRAGSSSPRSSARRM